MHLSVENARLPISNVLHKSQVLLLGCQYGNPSRKKGSICWVFFFFFSVSVKVLPVTPLLSGVFVHRAFCAYFLKIERVVGNA